MVSANCSRWLSCVTGGRSSNSSSREREEEEDDILATEEGEDTEGDGLEVTKLTTAG